MAIVALFLIAIGMCNLGIIYQDIIKSSNF